jgi:glycosyltransferase involved in cell wall biosynthesis
MLFAHVYFSNEFQFKKNNYSKNDAFYIMIGDKIITVVLPAYNASKTLETSYLEIPFDIVDHVILVDDHSNDDTVAVAKKLGIKEIILHTTNKGYGGNQKSCYKRALELKSDIIIMLHPDYQYTPKLIHSMSYLIANEVYDVVLGSRILGRGAILGGMPYYKYYFNRFLTLSQNILMRQKLSEYHTGYRAFSNKIFKQINLEANSDDFVFDNQMLAQIFNAGFEIAEITCPTKYFADASSINFSRSVTYGLGVLKVSFMYFLHKKGVCNFKIFKLLKSSELN